MTKLAFQITTHQIKLSKKKRLYEIQLIFGSPFSLILNWNGLHCQFDCT